MTALVLLALILVAASVAFIVSAAIKPGLRRSQHLEQIESYGYVTEPSAAPPESALRRSLDSLAAVIGASAAGRLRSLREDEIQKRLLAAGFFGIGARRFNGYRVLGTIAIPVIVIWLLGAAGSSTTLIVFLALVAAAFAWITPSILLSRRAQKRLEKVDHGLPELIDLLVVTLEAGVGFGGALNVAAERLDGPLGEEVRLTIQEQSLGLSITQALENWQARCESGAVRAFVRSMVQGERLGVSIGQILRNLAIELRARRKQQIEERAQKAPVKIIFPLVFLIFPAIFVIVLGPAMYEISGGLGGH